MSGTALATNWLPVPRAGLTVQLARSATLATELAQDIAQRLEAAIQARGFAVLSVSGGQSPIALFEALRSHPIDWSNVRVTLVDERCVPATHTQSNAWLVHTHLLQDRARAAHWVPMVVGTTEPLAPPSVQAEIASLALQAAGSADVLVLGMGTDGHTASLFPDAPNLSEALDRHNPHACVAVELPHPPANAPFPRVTQTLAQLLRARHIVLLVSEADKLATLRLAWDSVGNRYPISRVLQQTRIPVALWIAS